MSTTAHPQKADLLLALHTAEDLLILPNIWDPLGARILQTRGSGPVINEVQSRIHAILEYDG